MTRVTSLEETAQCLFEQEWKRLEQEKPLRGQPPDSARQALCVCPPLWLIPDLLALIEESHDQPVEKFTATIRRLILEQNFVDANGDGLIEVDEEARVDQLVQVLIRVLEKVRKIALAEGRWSDMPVTPLMCG